MPVAKSSFPSSLKSPVTIAPLTVFAKGAVKPLANPPSPFPFKIKTSLPPAGGLYTSARSCCLSPLKSAAVKATTF